MIRLPLTVAVIVALTYVVAAGAQGTATEQESSKQSGAASTHNPSDYGQHAPGYQGTGSPAEMGKMTTETKGGANAKEPASAKSEPATTHNPSDYGQHASGYQGTGGSADMGKMTAEKKSPSKAKDTKAKDATAAKKDNVTTHNPSDYGQHAPGYQGTGSPADMGNMTNTDTSKK